MIKKLLALFLTLTIVCSLAACTAKNKDDIESADLFDSTSALIDSETEVSNTEESKANEESSDNTTTTSKDTSQTTEKSSATVTTPVAIEEETENTESETPPPPAIVADIKVEETIVSDDVIPQPDTESINNSVVLNTNHSALSASEYYQLSSLSGYERTLYLAITDAITASESIVDVSKLSMNED